MIAPEVHEPMHKAVVTAAALMGLAALMCVAAIPAVFFDPDASVMGAAFSLMIVAVANVAMASAASTAQPRRAGLIVMAVVAAGMCLFALDGAASFSTHTRAPAVLPFLVWGVVAADAIAAVVMMVAAIAGPKPGPVQPAG